MKHASHLGVYFPRFAGLKPTDLRLMEICDANHGREVGSASQGGYFIVLTTKVRTVPEVDPWAGNSEPCAVAAWRSWKLRRVATGTLSAEGQGLEVCAQALLMAGKLLEFLWGIRIQKDLRNDHNGLIQHLTSIQMIDDVRTAVQVGAVKDMLQSGELDSCEHVSGLVNYADCLTKEPEKAISDKLLRELLQGRIRNMK